MTQDILNKSKSEMEDVLALVADDLKRIKTGRARPSLVEDLKVQAYNSSLTLKELASITAPDPHSLIISPWDKSVLKDIEKAISGSDLNLAAALDNDIIRIKIAPLTEESRKDLVKLVYQKLESGRRLLRQVRNEAKSTLEAQKGQPGVSEDNIKQWLAELQKLIEEYNLKIDSLGKSKEAELMSI